MKYFIWKQGLRGPEAQIWDDKTTVDGKEVKVLMCVALDADDSRSLDQLKLDMPCDVGKE